MSNSTLEPTEQLAPIAWIGISRRARTTSAGERPVADRAHRLDRHPHLGQVGEGLDEKGVDSALEEPFGLLAKGVAGLRRLDGADRGQILAERSDRSQHEHVAAHALAHVPRQLRPAQVDLPHPPLQAVHRKLEAVGAEGVRLDDVGAHSDVLGVNRLHELGIVQVQHVEARVEGDPARVEHGAHGPVAQQRPLGEAGQQRRRHDDYPAASPRPLAAGEASSRSRRARSTRATT
jgi:hypothetical protein